MDLTSGAPTKIAFTKMEGAGNDYVYVDAIRTPFDFERGPDIARFVADRRFGVGGDGLILLAPSEEADVRMVVWNADGSRAPMCGNGIRCVAKFAYDLKVVDSDSVRIETDSGVRSIELRFAEGRGASCGPDGAARRIVDGARVEMGPVTVSTDVATLDCAGRTWTFHPVDVGNDHAVTFVTEDPANVPVLEVGARLQESPAFPRGVNVEFVRVEDDGSLRQRTFERGSGETHACGTGATAAACAAVRLGHVAGPVVTVHLLGGDLRIDCRESGVVMEGPARTVFSGEIDVPIT